MYFVCVVIGLVIYFSYAKVRKTELEKEMLQTQKARFMDALKTNQADIKEEIKTEV